MAKRALITGWGKALPSRVLTNQDLESLVDTSDDWIQSRTGIKERHIAGPKESTATLATRAAHAAVEVADISPRKVDLIICATDSPDYLFPATACLVQDALGASHAAAFDLMVGCSGFIYALSVANSFILSGTYKTVLVIGAETMSKVMDYTDRSTCVLFGDGAGAVVLQGTEEEDTGLLGFVLGSDGSGGNLLIQPGGGSRHPATLETVQNRMHYLKMSGPEVYKFAVGAMAKATHEVLESTALGIEDIQLVVPHQANMRIIESASKSLKVPMERMFVNLEHVGNTSAAAVAIALVEAVESGRVHPSDNVLLVTFGAGLSWAATVLRWGAPPVVGIAFWKRLQYGLRHWRAAIRSWYRRQRLRIGAVLRPIGNGIGRL